MKKSFDRVIQGRMQWLLLFFLASVAALEGRLFLMTIVHHRDYVQLASRQHGLKKEILSERGSIRAQDKDGKEIPLALNKTYATLVVSPNMAKDKKGLSAALVEQFHLDRGDIEKKLSKEGDPHEVLMRKIDPEDAARFDLKRFQGVSFEEEKRRIYPNGKLAAQALGFVSIENDVEQGRYGLERLYEKELAGTIGVFEGVKDVGGFWIALGKRIVRPPQNGASLVVTIDYNIQRKAEETLRDAGKKWEAASGVVIVYDPITGRILADAVDPAFNPNEFSKEKDFGVFLNPSVESMYELGSVMKPITMAGGLQEGLVGPETTYTDPGEIRFGASTIRNFDQKSHGVQTMTQVLEKSLNTGAVYVARLLGHERQREYLERFGFGAKSGVDMPGEIAGNISNLNAGREIDFATAAFGQGIAITPMQLVRAIGAIANGGKLMKPYLVEKIIDDSGNEILKKPEVTREVISPDTAETLTKMLVSAVRSGFENKAGVKGYFVAGKTGTAQIPNRHGRGYSDKVIHTFVGYAPAFHPRFLILLQLNESKGNRFAANTLTPAFHDLAEFILNYYEVPPDEK